MFKMKKKLALLFVLVMVVSLALSGCGGGTTAPATGGGGSDLDDMFPEVRWTMATGWPEALSIQRFSEYFAKQVGLMSGGRFIIDVHPAGAVVEAFETMDAAHAGTIDAYHSFTGYWMGKHAAQAFFSSTIMTFDPMSHLTWLYEGGGLELWNELNQDILGMNVITFPGGMVGPELMGWFNREVKTVEDWRGLKFRTVAWWGEVLKEIGVSVTTLPAGELYPALERGVLDATEFSTPLADFTLKFYEVADYYAGPGMHQPTVNTEITINKDSFNALPANYQAIIENASRATALWAMTYDYNGSMEALEFYDAQGVTRLYFDEAEQHRIRKLGWDFIDRQAAQDPFIKKVWDSARDYYLRFEDYKQFMHPVGPNLSDYGY